MYKRQSQELLIGARAVQGIGAALLSPAALALIQELFPDPKERGTAIGIWGAVGALALAVGPLTGGVLAEHVSWGWIFLINLPIGVATLALSMITMKRTVTGKTADLLRRMDPFGLVTSSLALFALTYGLIEGDAKGWTSGVILGSFAVAAVSAIAFVIQQGRTEDSMVNLAFFRLRMFTGGLLAMGLWAFGVFGIYFYMAIYLQNVLGFSPTEAGAGFVPLALITAVGAVLAPRFEARFGVARVTAFGLLVMGASILGIAQYGEGTHYLDLLPWFALYGVGGGLLIPLSNVVLGALPSGAGRHRLRHAERRPRGLRPARGDRAGCDPEQPGGRRDRHRAAPLPRGIPDRDGGRRDPDPGRRPAQPLDAAEGAARSRRRRSPRA